MSRHASPDHAWVSLESPQDVEAWMDLHDRELKKLLDHQPGSIGNGCGACFSLIHGGEIFMHTNSDGDILLDVTPEAQWVSPVICACTGAQAARGQIWILPQHVLIELILGLNSLIASSKLVLRHEFSRSKF
jgi:hypothetical protein